MTKSERRSKVARRNRGKRLAAISTPLTRGAVSSEVLRYAPGGKIATGLDALAREEPLEIRVRGRSIAVTMRTPGHDQELAAGFLLSEGLIRTRSDIVEIAPCLESKSPENTVNVFLHPKVQVDLESLTRHVFASSSCGLCGKASIEAVHQHFQPVESSLIISPSVLEKLPSRLRDAQETFDQTGGLHAAAIFDAQGQLLVLREDVGRHNAVDKVLGSAFFQRATAARFSRSSSQRSCFL